MVVFVGRGLLGADGSPWGENGVIGTAEHPRGTFGYLSLKILCLSGLNGIWTNGGFRREGSSRSRRVPMRRKWCHWNRRAFPGDIWILIFENIVFIWIKWNLDKWWFSSGGVLSEQTGPHEAKMVSLEPRSIPRGHLDINIWKIGFI